MSLSDKTKSKVKTGDDLLVLLQNMATFYRSYNNPILNIIPAVVLRGLIRSNIKPEDFEDQAKMTEHLEYLSHYGHLEYSLVAYKLKTFDYLAKPITLERLEETVLRLVEDVNGQPKKYIKIDNKNTLVDENEILYIKREGMKLIYHTASKDYEAYSSFAKMEPVLPKNFSRCHKSFIVNLNKIVHVEPVSSSIYFDNNSSCEIFDN